MEMSKFSPLVLERVEWMPLSTHSVNSVMVETLKTCDVSESNYSGGNGLRDRNVVCDVTSMLSGEQMYCEINVINGTDAL